MDQKKKYIHAVPNFSEGRRTEVIEAIVGEIKNVKGVKLIDFFPDADFNRTVIECIGEPEPLMEALLNMAGKAYELIDMEKQQGAHPRIGAQDTIPVFPLMNVTLEECAEFAEKVGTALFERFQVPVYFSGENARTPERSELGYIRKGQYEGLKEVVHLPERAPDLGPAKLHPSAGATIVSAATSNLVAINVLLSTTDIEVGKRIAKMMRGPSGGFSTIRSVAFKPDGYDNVAVSMNMFDIDQTPIYRAFQVIENEAKRYGLSIIGTQVCGTLRQKALINCAEYFLRLVDFDYNQIVENNILALVGEE
ncbi:MULTISPECIES: glutamate formimidoyltransferase [Dethiosulfovibrio]|uniref:glutamate formimidoyltransferase n=2 Tax=Dethiosulfovibrio TaxID=47054 RepID=A0ABS9EV61_9BACT|nr:MULTISPECIES: glutamate formimidoyltransferase [Dethiosulfovibrio]MCF4115216.1 glutamate formimidoyltransferase [Dethiosulfovibrio russensis]MCF4143675.1 glutamate formimidoyltransferase [Dethiosulfovibrio marinus]MCF4146172.1 glutamate formimidoyltransferase [Dethiosulfovibrio acidaminovorans]